MLEESWKTLLPPLDNIEGYFLHCLLMCEECYVNELNHYRTLTPDDVTPDHFFSEYVWVVFASGFNTQILTDKFPALIGCYKDIIFHSIDKQFEERWERVKDIIANRAKHNAVRCLVGKIEAYMDAYGVAYWDEFKRVHFTVDALQKLPFIGEVNSNHLARNIGLDCVKPDRHLVRLASHFGFDSPDAMCSLLSGLHEERVGVVDFVLFSGARLWGTNNVED